MAPVAIPVATTCDHPAVDRQLRSLIAELVDGGLTIREATARAARTAADAAAARGWCGELVDFVVIRTVDLGAQLARTSA